MMAENAELRQAVFLVLERVRDLGPEDMEDLKVVVEDWLALSEPRDGLDSIDGIDTCHEDVETIIELLDSRTMVVRSRKAK